MKAGLKLGVSLLALGGVLRAAAAQEAAPLPPPPTLAPITQTPLAPPAPELNSVWSGHPGLDAHFWAEMGVGLYSVHPGGSFAPSMIGTSASVGVLNDHTSFGATWLQSSGSSTRTSVWEPARRP